MSPRSHGQGKLHWQILRVHALCQPPMSQGHVCGTVALQIHMPMSRGLPWPALRGDAGHLPRRRGSQFQLAFRHMHLLYGPARYLSSACTLKISSFTHPHVVTAGNMGNNINYYHNTSA